MHQHIPEIHRRDAIFRAAAALVLTPLLGCSISRVPATQPATASASRELARERHSFIQSAMKEMSQRNREKQQELMRRGVAAAMRVSTLVPFGDWDFYFVKGGTIFWRPNQGQTYRPVEVPEGFVSDLTSVPRLFWQVLRPEGRYAYAAVVHDYLYWTQSRSKEESDLIFKVALEDSKVEEKTVWAVYEAVHRLGQSAWDENQRLKRAGERRIIKRFPDDFTVSWSDWKKQPDVFR